MILILMENIYILLNLPILNQEYSGISWISRLALWLLQPWSLQWRDNDHDSISNHQPRGCLFNRLFRRRSKKTPKLRVTSPLCGEFTGPGEFPTQRASYAENVSIWWRHYVLASPGNQQPRQLSQRTSGPLSSMQEDITTCVISALRNGIK